MDDKVHEKINEEKPETAEAEAQSADTSEAAASADAAQKDDGSAETAKSPEAGDAAPEADAESAGSEEDGEAPKDTDEAGGSEAGETDGPEPASDGKWHVFGKKKEKKDPKDQKIEELTDQLKRQMAEFDNFRKRTEKEKSAMFEVGARSIIEKMLPVIDNFERGLATVPEDAKGTPFSEGMEMIYKQLLKNLEEAGVKPIEAVGQPFDPNFHNAVMHVEDENLGENIVAQEFQKGYMYRDTVVRHSMVQVAN